MNTNFLFLSLISLVFLASCNGKKEENEEVGKYTVTSAMVIDTSFTKEYVSQIKSIRNIEIRTQEKGFLEKIYVDEGQYVSAGQVLFRIMPKMYEAELLKAQAEAKGAEIELLNAKTLVDKNVISKNEQALAQAKLDMARAEVAVAKLHLSFTEIRAPFGGTIDRLPKKLGSLLEEGELLTTLSDNASMFAYFNVSEPEYLEYETNVKDRGSNIVNLKLANGEMHKYSGKIELIESEFDNETGNVAFRAGFPNPNKLLKNGETGKVVMTVPVKKALIIPQKATYEIQDKKYVFVVDKNSVVKSREIKVTGEMTDLYVVKSGILASDKILLDGVQKAKDDDKIKYDYLKPADVLSHLKLHAE
ncbi:MAG: efflux RND transporter periplasmic adaptor subunit [Flavobacterium sp.]|nr:efflux RND transporter periplasmic adaptor subunit [Flavobacterium sp.]